MNTIAALLLIVLTACGDGSTNVTSPPAAKASTSIVATVTPAPITVAWKVVVRTREGLFYFVNLKTGLPEKKLTNVIYNYQPTGQLVSPDKMHIAEFSHKSPKDYSVKIYMNTPARQYVGSFDGNQTVVPGDMVDYVTYTWLDNTHLATADSSVTIYVITLINGKVSDQLPQEAWIKIPGATQLRIVPGSKI